MRIGNIREYRNWLAIASLAVVAISIWIAAMQVPPTEGLTVTFLDVGQGDCIFLRTPSGKTILVDGGGGRSGNPDNDPIGPGVVEPFLRRQGVNRIDLMVLSHPHDDHVRGLIPVLRDFRVGMVLDPAIPHGSQAYRRFLELVEERGIAYQPAVRGQIIDFEDGLRAEVLHPPKIRIQGAGDDVNNNSIVIKITFGKRSLILTGDAGREAEADILSSCGRLRSDVLKVGHHGSDTSTTEAWLKAVKPKIAVICVGRNNSFGHPSSKVLDRLYRQGVKVYRTDEHGAVTLRSSGDSLEVESFGVPSGKTTALSK